MGHENDRAPAQRSNQPRVAHPLEAAVHAALAARGEKRSRAGAGLKRSQRTTEEQHEHREQPQWRAGRQVQGDDGRGANGADDADDEPAPPAPPSDVGEVGDPSSHVQSKSRGRVNRFRVYSRTCRPAPFGRRVPPVLSPESRPSTEPAATPRSPKVKKGIPFPFPKFVSLGGLRCGRRDGADAGG